MLSIAGSDCSAGAGIQADLKTFQTQGVYGLTALTGVVAETPHAVHSWQALEPEFLSDQLDALYQSYPIAAIKTGLLFNAQLVEVIRARLILEPSPLVIDPVGTASTGVDFGDSSLLTSITQALFPLATLVTPNLREAQLLSGLDTDNLEELALSLAQKHQTNFLVKGGHSSDPNVSLDILATPQGELTTFSLPRLTGTDFHGTGCTLSAAITAQLALQQPLETAISNAKAFLHNAIKNGHLWQSTSALNTLPKSRPDSISE